MTSERNDEEFDAKLSHRLAAEDGAPTAAGSDEEEAVDLERVQTALRRYRAESLEWAQQRSATMPSPLPAGARADRPAWLQAPQWVLGTAAFCACVVGGTVYTHHQATLLERAAAVLPNAPTQQALAIDNELLSSVDDALCGSIAPTEQELGLTNDPLNEEVQPGRDAPLRRD